MSDIDRFDRMLLRMEAELAARDPVPIVPAPEATPAPRRRRKKIRPGADFREPVITSERRKRFVDHATCSLCGARVGVEYHGELMSGAKVHTLAEHSVGCGGSCRGKERCLGAKMRVALVDGAWRGESST